MIAFWMMTGLLAALTGVLVLAGARREADAGASAETEAAAAELAELDRLNARGLLDADAWVAARAEAGRRILATSPVVEKTAARPRDRLLVLAGAALGVASALGLYLLSGQPGLPDQPYERRVDEWSTHLDTLEAPQIAAVIGRTVRERPGDHEALTLLGAARFEAGDPIGAASAFRRALAVKPDDARSWARLGESLVRANDGRVGADAEAAFRQALKYDPEQLGARYFLGEAALERNDPGAVAALWGPLIAALDARDPRRIELERRLPRAAS